jgi:hypothetical protein
MIFSRFPISFLSSVIALFTVAILLSVYFLAPLILTESSVSLFVPFNAVISLVFLVVFSSLVVTLVVKATKSSLFLFAVDVTSVILLVLESTLSLIFLRSVVAFCFVS